MGLSDPSMHNNGWHLRREITIGVLVALVSMLIGGISGWTTMQSDRARLELEVVSLQREMSAFKGYNINSRLAVLEERSAGQSEQLKRIEAKLDRALGNKVREE